MLANDHLLDKAITLYKNGKCDTARQLLLSILSSDDTNELAWIWYAETIDPKERDQVYKHALTRHPQMKQVQSAYNDFRAKWRTNLDATGELPITKPTTPAPQVQRQQAQAQAQPPVKPKLNGNGNGNGSHATRSIPQTQTVPLPSQPAAPQPPAPQPPAQVRPVVKPTAQSTQARPAVTTTTQSAVPQTKPAVAAGAAAAPYQKNYFLAIFSALAILALLVITLFLSRQAAAESQEKISVQQKYDTMLLEYTKVKAQYAQAQEEYKALQAQLGAQSSENGSLKSQLQALDTRYSALTADYQKLQDANKTLNDNYASLNSQYQHLQGKYGELDAAFNNLNGQYQQLQNDNRALADNYNQLNARYEDLKSQYNVLEKKYNDLLNRQGVPPYLTIHDGQVTLAYYRNKDHSAIGYMVIPLDRLQKDVERGYSGRTGLESFFKPTVPLLNPNGEQYTVIDYRHYVDANDFTPMMVDLYRQSGNDDDVFIREVWTLVNQLHIYDAEISSETPRYPMETLLNGGGDFGDTSILFASLIKAAPVNWKVQLVYMNEGQPNQVTKPNHILVRIETGSRVYLIETTNSSNMEPYPLNVAGWYLDL